MARRIKVLHFCDKFGKEGATIHGVTRLLSWWFARWDETRFDATLIGLRANDAGRDRIRETVPGTLSLERSKFDPRAVSDMIRLIRETRADIVHLHGYAATNFGRLAARVTGAKIVLHEHFVDPAFPGYQGLADRLLAPWCDHAFAVSKSVRDFMIQARHMPADRVEVLYNGAPLAEFSPPSAGATAAERVRWAIPPDHFVLGTVGRLDPQKGVRYLIDALPSLVERGHRVSLLVVGDGPLLGALKEQAQRMGVAQNVIFAGYQPNIPLIQSLFDVQVFPSLFEGTPLTLFEAMAMGRAIASTNVDGLGELLVDDRDARVVPPGNSVALAAALDDLLSDAPKRERLAAEARRESLEHDVARMVERMQTVYETLVPLARARS